MPSIFLCHSSQDKFFVRKLAEQLKVYGVEVWLDEAELNIGDSLTERIGKAIDEAEFVGTVLSKTRLSLVLCPVVCHPAATSTKR